MHQGLNGLRCATRFGICMNSELTKLAQTKVLNPNILINLISRRVRQLNAGGGDASRPLVSDTATLGAADIALRELCEDKMTFEMNEPEVLAAAKPKRRRSVKR